LRFAVHRPGIPVASPRSHGMPCRDVPCRVHVSIASVSAGHTGEKRLALAIFRLGVSTRAATLAGVCRADLLHPAGGFVLQSAYKHPPTARVDFPVQSGFQPDVATGVRDGALGRAGHRRHVQGLYPDQVIARSQAGGYLVCPVFAGIDFPRPEPGDGAFHPGPAVGPTSCTGQSALKVPQPPLPTGRQAWRVQQLAGGQGGTDGHTAVDAYYLPSARPLDGLRNGGESDMPPASPIPGYSVRPHAVRHRTRQAEPHPSRLWHPDITGPTAQSPDMSSLDGDDPEPFIPPGLPPRWHAMGTREEVCHCLGKITQRLLLYHHRPGSQPCERGTGLRQLPAVLYPSWCVGATGTPPRLLLTRQVPHEPGMGAMLSQDRPLGGGRLQPVPGHILNVDPATDRAEEGKRRSSRFRLGAPRCTDDEYSA